MKPSTSKYTCKVTSPVKREDSHSFCGDYRPLNLQTLWVALVEDVLTQLRKSKWFLALDLQSKFWQIRMAKENICKSTLITKFRSFDWTIMPFGMKNATSTFSKTMKEVFGVYMDKFLKVFVNDLNVHIMIWEEHLEHLWFVLLRLREINLKLNPKKCEFAKVIMTFLGHV